MGRLCLEHPEFAAYLRSDEAFRPKTMHPTSSGFALHLANSGAIYGKQQFLTNLTAAKLVTEIGHGVKWQKFWAMQAGRGR